MNINVFIQAHAYAEEKLFDRCFLEPPHYGIVGPEVMAPLAQNRDHTFVVHYDEYTTVSEFQESIDGLIWGFSSKELLCRPRFTFIYQDERFEIDDPSSSFAFLLHKYLDPESTGTITVCYLVCHDAGSVGPNEGRLRYYVYSHEAGKHQEPHIHVKDAEHNFKASVSIATGEIIVGSLPGKYRKIAKKEILSKKDYYYNCWNTLTDGLKVDINHHFGYIHY